MDLHKAYVISAIIHAVVLCTNCRTPCEKASRHVMILMEEERQRGTETEKGCD